MSRTPNFNLYVYGTEITNENYIEFLKSIAGDNDSNMTILDEEIQKLAESLSEKGTLIPVDTIADMNSIPDPDGKFCYVDENGYLYCYKGTWKQISGLNGESSYIHIRYGDSPAPTNLSTTPDDYMGVYIGTSENAPSTSTSYTWSKIKGDTGNDGKSAYQSATEGGYTGTEAQFYADLGAIGDIGAVLDAINGEVI